MENNFLNNGNQKLEHQYLKWNNLENIQKDRSSFALCLSEFIDNSIGSFELNHERCENQETLDIRIECYEKGDYLEYHIYDNANGIIDLATAMKQYETSEKGINNQKNQYGIGMKFAIFWLGKNGVIYTKQKGCPEQIGKFIKNDKNEVLTQIDNSYENVIKGESGTCIRIKEVGKSKDRNITYAFNSPDSNINYLKDFLGKRYFGYLNKDNNISDNPTKIKLNITLHVFDEKGKPKVIDVSNNKTIIEIKPKDVFDSCLNTQNGSKRKEIIPDSKIENFRNNVEQDSKLNKFSKEWNALLNDVPLIFYETMEIKLTKKYNDLESVSVPIKIGFQRASKKSSGTSGINIKHSGRYICHTTKRNEENELVHTINFRKREIDGGKYKWIIAELDLEKIPLNENCYFIKPDKNKSSILFNTDNEIFTFDNLINAYKNVCDKYINFINELSALFNHKNNDENNLNALRNVKDNNELGSLIDTYSEDQNDFVIKNNDKKGFLFCENDNKKEIRIKFDDEINFDNKIIKKDEKDDCVIYYCNEKYPGLNLTKFDKNDDYSKLRLNFFALLVYIDILMTNADQKSIENIVDFVTKHINRTY